MQTENQRKSYYPNSQGLYSPLHEHDACGVGLIVDTKARASHKIVLQGIEVLNRLMHRGAVGGDSQTGDGAGILVQMPDEFFRKIRADVRDDAHGYSFFHAHRIAHRPEKVKDAFVCTGAEMRRDGRDRGEGVAEPKLLRARKEKASWGRQRTLGAPYGLRTKEKTPDKGVFWSGGRDRARTYDLYHVKVAL